MVFALVAVLVAGAAPDPEPAGPDWPLTADDAALLETVEQLLWLPVDVGRAPAAELAEVPGVSAQAAAAVVAARGAVAGLDSLARLAGVPASAVPMLSSGGGAERWSARARLRWRTDTLTTAPGGSAGSARLRLTAGPCEAVVLGETDAGEEMLPDWWGGGLGWRLGRQRLVVGDFTAGFGQGLVLAAPHARSGLGFNDAGGAGALALPRYALENRGFRGLGLEARAGAWTGTLLASRAGRDARLNADGTVARLVLDGVHDDSGRLAERNQVAELSAGAALVRTWPAVQAGLVVCGQSYSRRFSPADPTGSFAGRTLGQAGLALALQRAGQRAGLDLAYSTGRGGAAALELAAGGEAVAASARVRAYDRRFFAPLGRWQSLSGREGRVDASGRVKAGFAGLELVASGNTYRDFQEDSLPASVRLEAGYRAGAVRLSLAAGRRYRLAAEQSRTGTLGVAFDLGRERVEVRLGDEYSETRFGRGLMAAVLVASRRGPFDLSLAGARFGIEGTGVRMYASEPGPGRTRGSYGTSQSAWRAAAGASVRLGRAARVGLKAGCEWKEQARTDAALELEVGAAGD